MEPRATQGPGFYDKGVKYRLINTLELCQKALAVISCKGTPRAHASEDAIFLTSCPRGITLGCEAAIRVHNQRLIVEARKGLPVLEFVNKASGGGSLCDNLR